MANITRYNPFGELLTRDSPFGDLFSPARNLFRSFGSEQPLQEVGIRLDVSEDDKAYTVRAEIPGVKKEDVKVSVDGNQVSISAEIKSEKEEKKNEKLLRRECYYGNAYRSFTVDQDINEAEVQAKYSDGILTLNLPKKPGKAAKQIAVS
jgi:HSP20 family protein